MEGGLEWDGFQVPSHPKQSVIPWFSDSPPKPGVTPEQALSWGCSGCTWALKSALPLLCLCHGKYFQCLWGAVNSYCLNSAWSHKNCCKSAGSDKCSATNQVINTCINLVFFSPSFPTLFTGNVFATNPFLQSDSFFFAHPLSIQSTNNFSPTDLLSRKCH